MPSIPPDAPSDPLRPLVQEILSGNTRAIESFLRTTGPAIIRVVRQILGVHHPEVPDVVQEASFAALDSLTSYRGESTVMHFVWRVAALTAMNARRRLQLRTRYAADLPDVDHLVDAHPSPLGLCVAAKRREAFRQLLDELPASQAEALMLHCVLGFTLEEASEAAKVPMNTLRSRLIAAKSALRKKMSDDPELYDLLSGVS